MSEERNQALVRRFYEEVLSERNPEAAAELVTSDYVCHTNHFSPDLPAGIEGAQRFVTEFLSGYPQLRFKVEKQGVEGENVHSQITA
ncbi:MAG TPA: ester cyclase, partial [Ktedonobacteraceae bacterium]|nr:ester cyclase [Ktedonobacteraceae bacterium]